MRNLYAPASSYIRRGRQPHREPIPGPATKTPRDLGGRQQGDRHETDGRAPESTRPVRSRNIRRAMAWRIRATRRFGGIRFHVRGGHGRMGLGAGTDEPPPSIHFSLFCARVGQNKTRDKGDVGSRPRSRDRRRSEKRHSGFRPGAEQRGKRAQRPFRKSPGPSRNARIGQRKEQGQTAPSRGGAERPE